MTTRVYSPSDLSVYTLSKGETLHQGQFFFEHVHKMARIIVALCLAHAAMVGDALGYGVPKKDPLEVPSEAYDVNADPDNTALVPITALGIPAVPGVPTVSGLAGPPNPAAVKGLAAGGPNPLNAVLNAVINAGADSTLMCIDAQMEVMVTTYQSIFEGNTLLEHWDFEIPKQYFQHSTALLSSS